MTIDEAIVSLRNSASKSLDYEWQREQYQIAEWLEELKDYRDKNKMVVRVDCENMDSIKDKIEELSKYAESQYNKAIGGFVNFASALPTVKQKVGTIRPMWLEEIAEQLKEGASDGNG